MIMIIPIHESLLRAKFSLPINEISPPSNRNAGSPIVILEYSIDYSSFAHRSDRIQVHLRLLRPVITIRNSSDRFIIYQNAGKENQVDDSIGDDW
jgi:hypothetical protein